jgi:transposase
LTASALIAEIGDIHRFTNSDKLARYSGIAPIKMGSGGKETMKKTKQGNRKLSEGKSKSQALLCIMIRLVRIIYGMMKNKTAYIMPEMPETIAS